jgi:hypothetical protein
MYVVWGQVHPIVQWFAIGTFPWQHFNQLEFFSFVKVVKGFFFFFFEHIKVLYMSNHVYKH